MDSTNIRLPSARGRILTAFAAASLLSLVFLGSPGCGCSDDLPDTPGEEARECCCEFEWIPPREVGSNATVDVVLVGAHPSLEARAQPAVLTGVTFNQTPPLFDICVQDDHTLGATVTVELRQQPGDVLRGRALLTYDSVCRPVITTSPNLPTVLTSTDCGRECCCEFDWLTPDGVGPIVDIVLSGASPGLTAQAIPTQLTNVGEIEWQSFRICVNADHPVPSQLEVQLLDAGSGALYGRAILYYDTPCVPGIEHVEGPNFNSDTFFSPDCGRVPQCCCTFEYTLFTTAPGPLRIEARNVDSSLDPTIDPADVVGGAHIFSVCVNANHDIDAFMDLVVVDTNTNQVVDAATIQWDPTCQAGITEQTPPPDGVTDLGDFVLIGCGEVPEILVKPR